MKYLNNVKYLVLEKKCRIKNVLLKQQQRRLKIPFFSSATAFKLNLQKKNAIKELHRDIIIHKM